MSDAPFSPDTGKGEVDLRPRLAGLRLSEDGTTVPLDAADAEPVLPEEAVADPPPAFLAEPLEGIAPWTPATEPHDEPLSAYDPLALEADPAALEDQVTTTQPEEAPPLAAIGPDDPDASASDEPEAHEPAVSADGPPEVSPILSALDAAEKQAEEAQLQSERPHRGLFGHAAETETFLAPPDTDRLARGALAHPQAAPPPERDAFGPDDPAPMPTPRDWPKELEGEHAGAIPARMPKLPIMAGAHPRASAEPHQPGESQRPTGPVADALDAAAKIAAEASAAADALDNLKRLLGHRTPNVEVATTPPPPVPPQPPSPPQQRELIAATSPPPPERHDAVAAPPRDAVAAPAPVERYEPIAAPPRFPAERRNPVVAPPPRPPERREPVFAPPPIPARPAPARMPLPSPRSLALAEVPLAAMYDGRGQRAGIVLRGFLAGLGLSLVAGVVLYIFISAG